jgi:hypothetical protein
VYKESDLHTANGTYNPHNLQNAKKDLAKLVTQYKYYMVINPAKLSINRTLLEN